MANQNKILFYTMIFSVGLAILLIILMYALNLSVNLSDSIYYILIFVITGLTIISMLCLYLLFIR